MVIFFLFLISLCCFLDCLRTQTYKVETVYDSKGKSSRPVLTNQKSKLRRQARWSYINTINFFSPVPYNNSNHLFENGGAQRTEEPGHSNLRGKWLFIQHPSSNPIQCFQSCGWTGLLEKSTLRDHRRHHPSIGKTLNANHFMKSKTGNNWLCWLRSFSSSSIWTIQTVCSRLKPTAEIK